MNRISPSHRDDSVQLIDPPEFPPMPTICESQTKQEVWAYAALVGYRVGLDEVVKEIERLEAKREGLMESRNAVWAMFRLHREETLNDLHHSIMCRVIAVEKRLRELRKQQSQ